MIKLESIYKQTLLEGLVEKAAEDFIKQSIKGTKWENKVYIAGGYVRDEMMGIDPKDIDIVVDSNNGGIEFSEWLTKRFGIYKPDSNPVVYPKFGTAKFVLTGIKHNGQDLSNIEIEAVMPRSEEYTKGSRKPSVSMSNMKDDAYRRDLTINSLFKNISTGKIEDFTGTGVADMQNKIIRTPIDPNKTFDDDALRMLRVVRFYAKYDYDIPLEIIKAIKNNAQNLQTISKERIREELNKILVVTNPEKALKLLKITGLIQYVIPEFKDAIGMTQNTHHSKDVFGHTIDVVKNSSPKLLTRLIALFHDIGKTVTRSVTPSGVHFYGHEDAGSDIARDVMKRLGYPNVLIDAVALGVKNHMKLKHGGDDAVGISDKTLRKFNNEMGEHLEAILDVIHADNISHSEASSMPNQIEIVKKRLESLKVDKNMKPTLPVSGNDLMKEFNLKPGRMVGTMLAAILDAWYENPNLTREDALNIAKSKLNNV